MKIALVFMGAMLYQVLCLAPAQADLLPPGDFLLRERMKAEPGFYDEADQFCRTKAVGAPCSLPGHAFDGGGDGRCERRLEARGRHAQLICSVKPAYTIDRQLPASPYQFSPTACWAWTHDKGFRERMAYLNARCEPAPVAADRFCKGKQANEACKAEITLQGRQEQRPGRCESDMERFDVDPPRVMSRPRLLCQSASPVQREIGPASPPDSSNASH